MAVLWSACLLFVRCCQTTYAKAPVVVALAGGSGSGKSHIAEIIANEFGHANVSILSFDRYYKDQSHLFVEERDRLNFDHPDALDSSLMLTHIKSLRLGETIEVPVYDFATHTRAASQTIAPGPMVLVDGILALAEPMLAEAFDFRIYVDTPADIRLARRIKRDMIERGRSVEGILEQYMSTVRPMHELFLGPSKARADVVVSGMDDADLSSLVTSLARATGLSPRSHGTMQRASFPKLDEL